MPVIEIRSTISSCCPLFYLRAQDKTYQHVVKWGAVRFARVCDCSLALQQKCPLDLALFLLTMAANFETLLALLDSPGSCICSVHTMTRNALLGGLYLWQQPGLMCSALCPRLSHRQGLVACVIV